MVLDENKQDRAVVFILLSRSPGFKDPMRVVFQRGVALHLGEDSDHDLARGRLLKIFERLVQPLRRRARDNSRVIVEIRGGLGRHHFARRTIHRQQRQKNQAANPATLYRIFQTRSQARSVARSLRPERSRSAKFSRPGKIFSESNTWRHGLAGAVFCGPKLNSTFGGVSAPSTAAKYGLG